MSTISRKALLGFGSAILLGVVTLGGCPYSWPGPKIIDARIMDAEGAPCFTVQDSAETRKFPTEIVSIQVSDAQSKAVVWDVGLVKAFVRVKADQCIPFGTNIKNSNVYEMPKRLEPGRVYNVSMNTDIVYSHDFENRMYQGQFCIAHSTNHGESVQDINVGGEKSCRGN